MDQFSRKFDLQNYKNAMEISKELKLTAPRVKTWELYDSSFSFPRIRRYEFVQSNMDMLEHFEDNLNTNISNTVNLENFIRVGKTIQANLNNKYHDGEFADPAASDPRDKKELTWADI
jgi:viroplasmin and RNaseH domain-containing protein